jgi:hypothetical protein
VDSPFQVSATTRDLTYFEEGGRYFGDYARGRVGAEVRSRQLATGVGWRETAVVRLPPTPSLCASFTHETLRLAALVQYEGRRRA